MKVKLEKVLIINQAIGLAVKDKISDSKLNYALAKNIKICKPFEEDFNEENKLRIESFGKKDESGEFKEWSDKKAADEKFKEILAKEIEIDFYTFERNDESDKLNPLALSELIDIIIIG